MAAGEPVFGGFRAVTPAGPPWIIVKPDDKKRARLACMQHFLPSLPYLKKKIRTPSTGQTR